jgi:misacylated tRNA(Ala) deacylase
MKEHIDPRMHSAEHILNQTMVRMFDCGRCFSSHIEKKKSKCDYHYNRSLTAEEVETIERKINDVIQSNLDIIVEFLSPEEARGQYDLTRVPDDQDRIRIVRIGNYDATPCIGNHVGNTREIGLINILSNTCTEGVLRIRYRLQ